MALKVAFQMDPIGPVNIEADSTFRLAEEALARGHEIFYYLPDQMFYREGEVYAEVSPLTVRRVKGDHFELGEAVVRPLTEMDVVWLRQDPPFDMHYITTTHLLDRISDKTLVVNDPFWVRNCPWKKAIGPISRPMPARVPMWRTIESSRRFPASRASRNPNW